MKVLAGTVPGGVADLASVIIPTRQQVVDAYFEFIINSPRLTLLAHEELDGRDLVCWCPLDQPCHADVLLELAA